MARKKSTFWKDFKAFISKGNVLDLAVATIIGSAFGAIVTSFTNGIIMPLVSLLFKAENLDELVVILRPEVVDPVTEEIVTEAITWQYGTLIQAIINFIIIALFLFILVRVITNAKKALDLNTKMKESIQVKLDKDEPLTESEEKWMALMAKKDPDMVPVKTPAPTPAAPAAPTTEELLTEILAELKNK